MLLLSVSGVNATGAFALLWGSILATRMVDLVVLAVLAVVLHLMFWRWRRKLALLPFDRELALCSGVAVNRLMAVLLVVVAVSIGAAIQLTGALLADALTILPALGARNLGRSLRSMVGWAIALGLVGNGVGFFVALVADQPRPGTGTGRAGRRRVHELGGCVRQGGRRRERHGDRAELGGAPAGLRPPPR